MRCKGVDRLCHRINAMSATASTNMSAVPVQNGYTTPSLLNGRQFIVDLSAIDLSQRLLSAKELERWNPHRGHMALVDWIVWQSPDHRLGVGLKKVRNDEFWVEGHFPGRAVFPGVLQVEAAAQVAVYLYNVRRTEPLVAAFTRIENCSFRNMVVPGDDLYLLCRELKWSKRGFTAAIQGVVNGKISFEAQIQGLAVS